MGFDRDEIAATDLDLLLTSKEGLAALKLAGTVTSMPVAERIFTALRPLESQAKILLQAEKKYVRFRFCPECLKIQQQSHLEVHCRFSIWRVCPLHQCLMEDVCPHCASELVLPFDMSKAGQRRSGLASLAECRHCGGSLASVQPVWLKDLDIDEYSLLRIENGRALLAALYVNKVMLDEGKWVQLRYCLPYLKAATFWGPKSWHLAHQMRAPCVSGD